MSTTATPKRRRRMPQPAAQPKSKEDTAEARAEREWAELVERATDEDNPASRQIKRALTLEKQVAEIRKRVNDNREYLRLMDRNDELTEDQAEFLEVFYPEKEKGERRSAAEVEATRKAREFARRNGDQ